MAKKAKQAPRGAPFQPGEGASERARAAALRRWGRTPGQGAGQGTTATATPVAPRVGSVALVVAPTGPPAALVRRPTAGEVAASPDLQALREERARACGYDPVVLFPAMAAEAARVERLGFINHDLWDLDPAEAEVEFARRQTPAYKASCIMPRQGFVPEPLRGFLPEVLRDKTVNVPEQPELFPVESAQPEPALPKLSAVACYLCGYVARTMAERLAHEPAHAGDIRQEHPARQWVIVKERR